MRIRHHFLIADGNKAKREAMMEMLRSLGHTLFEQAPDGASAFQILKRRPVTFVFAAWDMPQMNGITLLKIVSADEELFNIPFVITTSFVSREMVVEAGKYGVSSILVEPIREEMLKQKIHSIVTGEREPDKAVIEDLFTRAKQHIQDGEYDAALAVYREILDKGEDAEVYYNIGYIKAAQGKYDEAIIAFRKAVMINNLHGRAYKMMGEVYLKKGDQDEAEKYFEKSGAIFLERNMDAEAEEVFREVLKLNPNIVNMYNSLGIIYRRRRNYAEAIKLYRVALQVDPEDENIHFNLGRTFIEDRQIDEAKKSFQRALELNPDFLEARRMIQAIEVGF